MNKVTFLTFTFFLLFAEMIYADSLLPKVALDWKPMFLDLQECVKQAKKILDRSDFDTSKTNISPTLDGVVFGLKKLKKGGKFFYIKSAVRCVSEHKIIFFTLASEATAKINLIENHMNEIFAEYDKLDWGQGSICEDCECERFSFPKSELPYPLYNDDGNDE